VPSRSERSSVRSARSHALAKLKSSVAGLGASLPARMTIGESPGQASLPEVEGASRSLARPGAGLHTARGQERGRILELQGMLP